MIRLKTYRRFDNRSFYKNVYISVYFFFNFSLPVLVAAFETPILGWWVNCSATVPCQHNLINYINYINDKVKNLSKIQQQMFIQKCLYFILFFLQFLSPSTGGGIWYPDLRFMSQLFCQCATATQPYKLC